jgi:hypothetical protein
MPLQTIRRSDPYTFLMLHLPLVSAGSNVWIARVYKATRYGVDASERRRTHSRGRNMVQEFGQHIFETGASVIVDAAPFQGVRGTVLGLGDDQRLIVMVALFCGVVALFLDPVAVHTEHALAAAPLITH